MTLSEKRKIKLSHNNAVCLLIIIFVTCIALAMCLVTENVFYHIASMWSLCIVAIIISKFDFFHPYFWFSLFFTLYSTAYAILWAIGLRSGNYSKESILYPIIALSIVLIIVGPKKTCNILDTVQKIKIDDASLKKIIDVITVLTIIASFVLLLKGYSSKTEMRSSGDLIYRGGVHIVRFLTFFVLLYISDIFIISDQIPWKTVIICGIASLIFSLFTSERDVVFRYGYTVIMLLFALKKIKPRHLPVLLPISAVVMVGMVVFKTFFLRGNIRTGTGNLFFDFLSSDFTAAGRNFQYLLEKDWTKGALGIKTFFTELFNPFLIGISKVNPDRWFNYTVHTGKFKGYAFTLVGTGYAISGLLGVVLVFITIGILIRIFYKNSSKNIYWLASYIYLTSLVIFSFRQSLQTITGALVKHILLAVLFCMIFEKYKIKVRKQH